MVGMAMAGYERLHVKIHIMYHTVRAHEMA